MFKASVTTLHTSQLPLRREDIALLDGLPLHQQDGNFSFIHKSVQEFFVACAWVRSLTSTKPNLATTLFGSRLASTDAGLLRFIALLCNHGQHCGPLVNLVLASRNVDTESENTIPAQSEPEIRNIAQSQPELSNVTPENTIPQGGPVNYVPMRSELDLRNIAPKNAILAQSEPEIRNIAAANAITVLNSTRFSFSGMDLSGINIPGAILDNAMLHKTNLSRANLADASVKEVCMDGADISGSTLSRVFFGRQADIILPDTCCAVVAGREGFVVVTKVCFYFKFLLSFFFLHFCYCFVFLSYLALEWIYPGSRKYIRAQARVRCAGAVLYSKRRCPLHWEFFWGDSRPRPRQPAAHTPH
jgi:hypothetical protein